MTSLRRIIKQGDVARSEGVFRIPDLPPPPLVGSPEEEAALESARGELLRGAREEGERLSAQMLQEAEAERDGMLEKARQEAGNIRAEAWQSGYDEGARQKSEDIDVMLEHVGDVIDQLIDEHKAYMRRYEHELADFALEIASRILAKKVDEDDLALLELVRQSMAPLKEADWISIELCDELPQLIATLEQELEQDGQGPRVDILPRDVEADTLILQTSTNVTDASLSTQLKNLRELFEQADG